MSDITSGQMTALPEQIRDPYGVYRRLRETDPVHWDGGGWVLTRYADIAPLLKDQRMAAERITLNEEFLASSGLRELFETHARMMLFNDAPTHTRLRGLVNRAFTPRTVESLRGWIQETVDELLEPALARGSVDLIAEVAYPLPVLVISRLLGVPKADREQIKSWSEGVAAFIGGTSAPEAEMLAWAQRCVVELSRYVLGLAQERRRHPGDDLVSALVAGADGERLSEDELVANAILLMVAGHETTTNLIGNGTLALLQNPSQLELLRSQPDLIVGAVEELLRYDSPVQGTSRLARAEIEVGGRVIQPGQNVSLMLAAGNRDPEQFADPDTLDITRRDVRHLSFGHGAHFCVGAPLARMEGQIAIGTLLRRAPGLRLATSDLHWRDNYTLRGLLALPLAL